MMSIMHLAQSPAGVIMVVSCPLGSISMLMPQQCSNRLVVSGQHSMF